MLTNFVRRLPIYMSIWKNSYLYNNRAKYNILPRMKLIWLKRFLVPIERAKKKFSPLYLRPCLRSSLINVGAPNNYNRHKRKTYFLSIFALHFSSETLSTLILRYSTQTLLTLLNSYTCIIKKIVGVTTVFSFFIISQYNIIKKCSWMNYYYY